MPGTQKGYTTPDRCATVGDNRSNRPSDRDYQARHRLQEKASDFSIDFHGLIYLSIDAKHDIYNKFDPLKPVSICLNPPSTKEPPLVELKQEGKESVYTTDFYFTHKEPSDWVFTNQENGKIMFFKDFQP